METLNTDIDLTKIDWNKLSRQEYFDIEQKLQANHKALKAQQRKEPRNSGGTVAISIMGKTYTITEALFRRLKTMKSERSREKLINKIVTGSNPVMEI